MTGGVERYRPVPAIPGAVRPARAVLLYFDDDGRRMALTGLFRTDPVNG